MNGHSTSFLVDTGAAVTLMRKDTWDQVNDGLATELEPWSERQLVSVDGTPLQVHGQACVDIVLDGTNYQSGIVVVSPLTTNAILGLDFMRAHEVSIDLGRAEMRIGQKRPLKIGVERSMGNAVCLVDSIVLPPLSERVVIAYVCGAELKGPCLVDDSGSPCCVARALVEPLDGRVPVRLLNPKSEIVRIPKDVPIGSIEEIIEPTSTVANVSATSEAVEPNAELSKFLWQIVEASGTELDQDQKEQFFVLLSEYADVFAQSSTDFGRTDKLQHEIHTGCSPPIRQAARRLPPQRRQEVKKLLKTMLDNNVIQPSKSPWSSPIVLVKKKDNSLRFCVDYRKLNDITYKDAYPLPRIDDTLNTLAGSNWFSTLDLLSGYWQVEVDKKDQPKTAFCTTEGLFEFKVMPFGLCNAPATFQRLMDLVLTGLHWSHCLVYLDDVIILGRSFTDHLANLQEVLRRFRQAGLKLQPKKCKFLQHKVQFLGHIVSNEGVAADPSKMEKVVTWPTPRTTKEVQQFLGFAGYYRRFIRDFAKIAKPLHKLTEHKVVFHWTPDCQAAFDALKRLLTTSPVLAYPDYSRQFILDTDASDTGIGAVLSQLDDTGQERVIAYASRLLSKPERQYCVTRRELLAVVVFTRHFRSFLLGTKFIVRTDHGSLTWLKNFKDPEGQMARWLERLQEFDFSIVHRQGRNHNNADALSRLPCRQCGRESHTTNINALAVSIAEPLDIGQAQKEDLTVGPVFQALLLNEKPPTMHIKSLCHCTRRLFQLWDQLTIKNGKLYRLFLSNSPDENAAVVHQLVIPKAKTEEVLRDLHSGTAGGHLGEDKMLARVRERFYWPGYHQDVCNWCKTCPDCAATKANSPHNRAPLQSIKIGSPMQMIAVDILGPFPESDKGNTHILVVGDYFTRWMEAFAIPNQEATTIAHVITQEVFCRFSPPEQLHSDQGKQFESELIAEVCRQLGIAKTRTTPYHPQSDGLIERFNRTLLSMLRAAATDHPFDWEDHLRPLCMAYNSSVQATTGYSPFYLMFGRQPRMPIDIMYGDPPSTEEPETTQAFAQKLKFRLQHAYGRVRSEMGSRLDRQKELYDRRVHGNPYNKDDLVWLHSKAIPRGVGRKLHRQWTGPFRILKKLSDAVYRLQNPRLPRQRLVVHFDRLKPCPKTMRLDDLKRKPDSHHQPTVNSSPPAPGTHLQELDDDDAEQQQTHTHRYPRRVRREPDRLIPYVPHGT